jgi:hypothetical protein
MMFDCMIMDNATARQQERLQEFAHEARLAEALRGSGPQATITRAQRQRAAIAGALRALAFQLAPPEDPATTMRRSAGAQP